jgi:hypothetical protein
LTNAAVHGPAFSGPTTKIRCYLVHADIPFEHDQHMKDKPQGFKPNTDCKKVPILDAGGRQVNDSGVILKFLLPTLDLEFNKERMGGSFCFGT